LPELRKDYILDRYVIIATERGKRPHQLDAVEGSEQKKCFFCPGHENETPPEIYRVDENGKWRIRVFANKFPAVALNGKSDISTDNQYYTFADAVGRHEVIVETASHDKQLSDLSEKKIAEVLRVYKLRQQELSRVEGVKYVSVFKNKGEEAGCSIAHTHSQIIAYNIIPPVIESKTKMAMKDYNCAYCGVIQSERVSNRMIYEDDNVVAFTPYASRFAYEVVIFPIKHITGFDELDDATIYSYAKALKVVLLRLKELNAPYNFYFQYGGNLHLHLEIAPRFSKVKWAGFELSTGTIINPVSPEVAAEFYRNG